MNRARHFRLRNQASKSGPSDRSVVGDVRFLDGSKYLYSDLDSALVTTGTLSTEGKKESINQSIVCYLETEERGEAGKAESNKRAPDIGDPCIGSSRNPYNDKQRSPQLLLEKTGQGLTQPALTSRHHRGHSLLDDQVVLTQQQAFTCGQASGSLRYTESMYKSG